MNTTTIDLVPVGLAERNTLVLRRFDALPDGATLELVFDAPPWVTYHQLRTDRFEQFDWQLVEPGPERWLVRILKRASTHA